MAINLLAKKAGTKEEVEAKLYLKKVIRIGVFTFFGVMLIIAAKYGFNQYQISELDLKLSEIVKREEPLQDYLGSYQKYSNHTARTVLSNRVYISEILGYFNESKTPDVIVTGVTINSDLTMVATGYSQKGIKAFTIYEKNLEKRGYTDITIINININQDMERVDFSINLRHVKK